MNRLSEPLNTFPNSYKCDVAIRKYFMLHIVKSTHKYVYFAQNYFLMTLHSNLSIEYYFKVSFDFLVAYTQLAPRKETTGVATNSRDND